MSSRRMHPDQLDTSESLARDLVREQFPHWAALPLRFVPSDGTANAMVRLGDEMVVRLPLQAGKQEQIDKEYTWLPILAPNVPLAMPVPLAMGAPTDRYPSPWTVCRWLVGNNASLDRLADPIAAARTLADFVHALQRIDASNGPMSGDHNFVRGVPLSALDERWHRCVRRTDRHRRGACRMAC